MKNECIDLLDFCVCNMSTFVINENNTWEKLSLKTKIRDRSFRDILRKHAISKLLTQ